MNLKKETDMNLNPPKYYFKFVIEEKDLKKMVEMIKKEDQNQLTRFLREKSGKWRNLALYIACKLNKNQFVLELRDEMEDFNTILEMSCLAGNFELSNQIISNQSCDLKNPLIFASTSGNIEIVKLLISKGFFFFLYFFFSILFSIKGAKSNRAICMASQTGNLEAVKLLFENGK